MGSRALKKFKVQSPAQQRINELILAVDLPHLVAIRDAVCSTSRPGETFRKNVIRELSDRIDAIRAALTEIANHGRCRD